MRTSTFVKGVAASIYEMFGDEVIIYENDVEQNLGKECFLITVTRSDFARRIKGTYVTSTAVDLAYFPADGGDNSSMYTILPNCIKALALINCDGELVRGDNISSNIVDDVLHVSAEYFMTLMDSAEESEKMESLEQNIGAV